ncbi:glycoside hydrolase family 88 protein [Schleiferilactobacillus shenzhenensis]|uniref:Glycosyl hydrolase family 88 n=1 Tax=Schleiferilactobacillus shenzhenensis LY-73 TaxID=1231336 RepID=U4TS30_9LACO|nr:glycoside hydrolase family 88 protein [Schleiferilactobacillus shenzhenensis]ERL64287.1 hypothetical protein L248_1055 [Schleiferilactobacillus shenzhenensis LY-73]
MSGEEKHVPLWAATARDQAIAKLTVVAQRNAGVIPYTTDSHGRFVDMAEKDPTWWTNGFWGGLMWQLYHVTGSQVFRDNAETLEKQLDPNLMAADRMDHDNGFKWLPTAVTDFVLTGNPASRNRGLLAAENLAGRFNPVGNFIRAWNDKDDGTMAGRFIIDCLMNLPLLYWASRVTHDPRFKFIAEKHAETAVRYLLRPDGSVNHMVDLDPETGAYQDAPGGQGAGEGSSWTRGQGWALYGFALSYRHTGDSTFLTASQRVANYFLSRIPASGLIPVDFAKPNDWEDTSAAAIAACGLLELAEQVDSDADAAVYRAGAERLLQVLTDKRAHFEDSTDYLLAKGTAAFHDDRHEFPMIYGDYFYLEGLLRLTGQALFIW